MEAIANFFVSTGFYQFFQGDNWKSAIMLVIAVVLLFLGIVKKFEPLLLVPIAFGMLVTNLPGAEMFHEILFAGGHVHWDLFQGGVVTPEFIAEMQALGVSSLFLCVVTMFLIYVGLMLLSAYVFGAALLLLVGSLGVSIWEIQISVRALEIHLKDMENPLDKRDSE